MKFLFVTSPDCADEETADIVGSYAELVKKLGNSVSTVVLPTRDGVFPDCCLAKKSYDKVVCFGGVPPSKWSDSGELFWVQTPGVFAEKKIPDGATAIWDSRSACVEGSAEHPRVSHAHVPNPGSRDDRQERAAFEDALWRVLFDAPICRKREREKSSKRVLCVVSSFDGTHGVRAIRDAAALAQTDGVSVFLAPIASAEREESGLIWEELSRCGARVVAPDPRDWRELEIDLGVFYWVDRDGVDDVENAFRGDTGWPWTIVVQGSCRGWDLEWDPQCVVVEPDDALRFEIAGFSRVESLPTLPRVERRFSEELLRETGWRGSWDKILGASGELVSALVVDPTRISVEALSDGRFAEVVVVGDVQMDDRTWNWRSVSVDPQTSWSARVAAGIGACRSEWVAVVTETAPSQEELARVLAAAKNDRNTTVVVENGWVLAKRAAHPRSSGGSAPSPDLSVERGRVVEL